MRAELTEKLNNSYPEIFGEGEYFACNDGWYDLINGLCDEIMQFCKRFNQEPPKTSQVKEKFGGLRFYVWSAPQEVMDIIDKYELRSQYTCELCGEAGRIHSIYGWYTCFCDRHYAEELERRNGD